MRGKTANKRKHCENKGWLDEEVNNGWKAKESYFKTEMQKRARGESQGESRCEWKRKRGEEKSGENIMIKKEERRNGTP